MTAARSPASPAPGGPRRAAQPELSALCTPRRQRAPPRNQTPKKNMAQDGLYTKLHLAVRARTQPGQVVLVSGSATSDRTSGALEMVTSPDQYPIWRTPKPVIIARGVRHDYRYSIRSAHDVEAEQGHVRSVKTNTPELHKEDDFGVTPPEPPDVPLKKPSPTPGASRLVIVCYHLPVRVVRDAQNNWTASWGSSIIAKSPSESIADSRETWWAGTIHGGTISASRFCGAFTP